VIQAGGSAFDVAGFTLLGYPIAMFNMAPVPRFLLLVIIFSFGCTAQLSAQTPVAEEAGQHFQAAQEAERRRIFPLP